MLRSSPSAAWSDIASRTPSPDSASARMPGITPEVETVMWRMPRLRSFGSFSILMDLSTASVLRNGSPMPM